MEKVNGTLSRYIAEFLGTGILIIMGVGSAVIADGSIGALGIGLAFGLTLMFLVYAIGPKSGCHINPAVTLTLLCIGHINVKDAILYMVMQILGGIAGAYIVYLIATGKADFNMVAGFASNGFGVHSPAGYSMQAVLLTEFIMTSILLMAVVTTMRPGFPLGFAGVVIGFVLVVIHLVSMPVSNTSVNFARSLGTALIEKGWTIEQLWVFAIAQAAAALTVGVVYRGYKYCSYKMQTI
ncbi:MAG: aquaporin [Candidatus Paracaedibacteraceae bacterium]|nr:aquaporin [Candidatus Paracaedibacteraceae bacterium]